MEKRGQVTSFIIIGLVLLIFVSLIIYFNYFTTIQPLKLERSKILEEDLLPIRTYVEQCIDSETKLIIDELGKRGGIVTQYTRDYNGNSVSYWCVDDSPRCRPTIILKESIEKQIAEQLEKQIDNCINLAVFESVGYSTKKQFPKVEAIINKDVVTITLNYPISLTRENNTQTLTSTFREVIIPLGSVLDLARDITNSESIRGDFNIDEWTKKYPYFTIEKKRPYPDKVYIIKNSQIEFQFAIQGSPQIKEGESQYGSCLIEGQCFSNIPQSECVNGFPSTNPFCSEQFDLPEGNRTSQQCGNYREGDSWCQYDTLTGQGYDTVGSRHFKVSCVNGEELIEECRDYREQLCTQQGNTAICRINRAESCNTCTTKQCCEDTSYRDCNWNPYLKTQQKCSPEVPSGFRFWEQQGQEICLQASETTTCEGLSCPQSWVDSAATLCYKQGDCGDYRNVKGDLGIGGFIETDLFDDPKNIIPTSDTLFQNRFLALPFTIQTPPLTIQETPTNNVLTLVTSFLKMIDQLEDEKQEIDVLSSCGVWQAPIINDCDRCGDGLGPCTEYECRSLGTLCAYEEQQGIPLCTQKRPSPGKLQTKIDDDSFTPIIKNGIDGYLHSAVPPYSFININIETTKPARCNLEYIPSTTFAGSPAATITQGAYDFEHSTQLIIPAQQDTPNFITNNIEDSTIALSKLYSVDPSFSASVSRFLDDERQRTDVIGIILDGLRENKFTWFITCRDEAGQLQEKPLFIQVPIDTNYVDEIEPTIKKIIPPTQSGVRAGLTKQEVNLYLDEPALCKWDSQNVQFENMLNTFSCANSPYDISPVENGSYRCRGLLPLNTSFILCRDKPPILKTQKVLWEEGTDRDITLTFDELKTTILHTIKDTYLTLIVPKDYVCTSSDANNALNNAINNDVNYYPNNNESGNNNNNNENVNYSGEDSYGTTTFVCNTTNSTRTCNSIISFTNNTKITCGINPENSITQQESTEYTLKKSTPLEITKTLPNGIITNPVTLSVQTNRNAQCGYTLNPFAGFIDMQNNEATLTLNDGEHEYWIVCTDEFKNEATTKISFMIAQV